MNIHIKNGVKVISDFCDTLSNSAGVYRMIDDKGVVLYVGKAKILRSRVRSYTHTDRLSSRLLRMVSRTHCMEVIETHTEAEALLLESDFIKTLKPYYNILLRDDKSYPEIELSFDKGYPSIKKHRGVHRKGARYFGPFASANAVNESIRLLENVFYLGTDASKDTKRNDFKRRYYPVLKNQFMRTFAPSTMTDSIDDFDTYIDEVIQYLAGKDTTLLTRLQKKMQACSDSYDFEMAGMYRDRIRALSGLHLNAGVSMRGVDRLDSFSVVSQNGIVCIQVLFYRDGMSAGSAVFFPRCDSDNLDIALSSFLVQFYQTHDIPSHIYVSHVLSDIALLTEHLGAKIHVPKLGVGRTIIQQGLDNAISAIGRHKSSIVGHMHGLSLLTEVLDLDDIPNRIEVYDNSHTSGDTPIGAMIVVGQDGYDKKSYRTWNIKADMLRRDNQGVAGDDYAMMREVFTRRFTSALKDGSVLPDIVVVDGGRGQLHVVLDVLDGLGLDKICVICIAKGKNRNDGTETFYMRDNAQVPIGIGTPLHHFMERIRDEAHRFVITKHRKKRSKSRLKSSLDGIEGIGAKRRLALLHYFGSAKAVGQSSIDNLQKVDGISKSMACKIYAYFNT